jgi:hypothetical protein
VQLVWHGHQVAVKLPKLSDLADWLTVNLNFQKQFLVGRRAGQCTNGCGSGVPAAIGATVPVAVGATVVVAVEAAVVVAVAAIVSVAGAARRVVVSAENRIPVEMNDRDTFLPSHGAASTATVCSMVPLSPCAVSRMDSFDSGSEPCPIIRHRRVEPARI